MKKAKHEVLQFVGKIIGFFPQEIPRTPEKLNKFIINVLAIYGLPDNSSLRHAVATMILQLNPNKTHVRPIELSTAAKSAIYRECAYQIVHDIKEETKKLIEEKKLANELAHNESIA